MTKISFAIFSIFALFAKFTASTEADAKAEQSCPDGKTTCEAPRIAGASFFQTALSATRDLGIDPTGGSLPGRKAHNRGDQFGGARVEGGGRSAATDRAMRVISERAQGFVIPESDPVMTAYRKETCRFTQTDAFNRTCNLDGCEGGLKGVPTCQCWSRCKKEDRVACTWNNVDRVCSFAEEDKCSAKRIPEQTKDQNADRCDSEPRCKWTGRSCIFDEDHCLRKDEGDCLGDSTCCWDLKYWDPAQSVSDNGCYGKDTIMGGTDHCPRLDGEMDHHPPV